MYTRGSVPPSSRTRATADCLAKSNLYVIVSKLAEGDLGEKKRMTYTGAFLFTCEAKGEHVTITLTCCTCLESFDEDVGDSLTRYRVTSTDSRFAARIQNCAIGNVEGNWDQATLIQRDVFVN